MMHSPLSAEAIPQDIGIYFRDNRKSTHSISSLQEQSQLKAVHNKNKLNRLSQEKTYTPRINPEESSAVHNPTAGTSNFFLFPERC